MDFGALAALAADDMSGAAFLSIKKLKGGGVIAMAARHNRRVIQAELGAAGSIDPTRTGLNETLRGPPTADGVAQLGKELMRAAGVGKLRKDAVMGLEVVFSLPPDHPIDDRAYFNDCVTWVADQFGGDQNILSADVHRDEPATHCHVILLPLLAGKMNGSNMMGDKRKLTERQQHFHREVACRYGLSKAPARLRGESKHDAAAAVLGKLRTTSDAALRSKAWPTLRAAIENDPAPFVLALGIELERPKKRLRSMTAIFTSPGKGPKQEPNPIGFAARPEDRTLSCVGFTSELPPPAPTPRRPAAAPATPHESYPRGRGGVACDERTTDAMGNSVLPNETIRVRDCDLDPALFDPTTGEFMRPPLAPSRRNREAADDWVATALTKRGG